MTSRRLVISLLCMCSWSFGSVDGVQQWSSVKSIAGDMLMVENFTDDKKTRTVGRLSKASGDGSQTKGTSKLSKSGKGKGSRSKGSNDTKETKSKGSSTDDSNSDKDSKSDTDSSTKSSDDEATKSSQSDSKSDTSESTKTDRTASSSSSDDSRDPSESSESDDTNDISKQDTIEENVTKDSKDGPFPTDSEDQPPTKKPTSSPTRKPSAKTPTAAGLTDKIPTSSPSRGPTVPPTDNVFDQPTVADTPEPTYFPTDTPKCQLNALGAFGDISQDRREFEFFYQIETRANTTEDILKNDVLPRFEREYGNRLLALLFTECGEDRRLQVGGDSCQAIGYSGLPIDRALAGVSCMPGSRVETSNTCYAVDGGLRMYFYGECTAEADEETMTAIRDVINNGDYDRLDPRIVNVIYLDISDIRLDDANTRVRSGGSSETTKLPGYAIVLLTIATLCIVGGFFLFAGRRKPQDKNGFDVIPDDEGEGDF